MRRLLIGCTGFALILGSHALAGEATAVSYATNGGSASATSTAVGNARSTAIAGATRGGRAIADSRARGVHNGCAEGRSVAVADRGLAISTANANAVGLLGGRAIADSESIAATIGGLAISSSDAQAEGVFHGHASSRSVSTALSEFGTATSDSRVVSRGRFGGRAVGVSDSLSSTSGGVSTSNVRVLSDAGFHARSHANGVGVSVSGRWRPARSDVVVESRARDAGRSWSDARVVTVRP